MLGLFLSGDAHHLNLLSLLEVESILLVSVDGTSQETLQALGVLSGESSQVLNEVGKRQIGLSSMAAVLGLFS